QPAGRVVGKILQSPARTPLGRKNRFNPNSFRSRHIRRRTGRAASPIAGAGPGFALELCAHLIGSAAASPAHVMETPGMARRLSIFFVLAGALAALGAGPFRVRTPNFVIEAPSE